MTDENPGAGASFGEKFELLFTLFPHPDRAHLEDPKKRRWKQSEIEEASGGRVSQSYLTGLRSGRFSRPGLQPLHEISKVMGFPLDLWLEDVDQWESVLDKHRHYSEAPSEEVAAELAGLVEQLFVSIPNRETGEQYTNEEVARASHERLTVEDLANIRGGHVANPRRMQLLALSNFFKVDYSYWQQATSVELPVDPILYEGLRKDPKAMLVLQKALGLSNDQKDLLLILAEQLADYEQKQGRSTSDDD